jgi:hypothetical protein
VPGGLRRTEGPPDTFGVVATRAADRGDLAELAYARAALHPELEGAMQRAKGTEEERVFILLERAHVEARYSKSYRVTNEELETFRRLTYDRCLRVRRACLERMGTFRGRERVGELPEPPLQTTEEERERVATDAPAQYPSLVPTPVGRGSPSWSPSGRLGASSHHALQGRSFLRPGWSG